MTSTDFVLDLGPYRAKLREDPPWMLTGVFTPDTDIGEDDYPDGLPQTFGFVYSVGLQEHAGFELFCPSVSIEGRYGGPRIVAMVLNLIGWAAIDHGERLVGTSCPVPIGVTGPDGEWERDAEAIFWFGDEVETDRKARQANMAYALGSTRLLPMRWSSPLGFRDEG